MIFQLTLTFDPYIILIAQSQLFIFKWSYVSTMYESEVVSVFDNIKKHS